MTYEVDQQGELASKPEMTQEEAGGLKAASAQVLRVLPGLRTIFPKPTVKMGCAVPRTMWTGHRGFWTEIWLA